MESLQSRGARAKEIGATVRGIRTGEARE